MIQCRVLALDQESALVTSTDRTGVLALASHRVHLAQLLLYHWKVLQVYLALPGHLEAVVGVPLLDDWPLDRQIQSGHGDLLVHWIIGLVAAAARLLQLLRHHELAWRLLAVELKVRVAGGGKALVLGGLFGCHLIFGDLCRQVWLHHLSLSYFRGSDRCHVLQIVRFLRGIQRPLHRRVQLRLIVHDRLVHEGMAGSLLRAVALHLLHD